MWASKKTTIAGIAAILASIVAILNGVVSGDINTVDWASVIPSIAAGVGLVFSRDNSVTSEQAGAK